MTGRRSGQRAGRKTKVRYTSFERERRKIQSRKKPETANLETLPAAFGLRPDSNLRTEELVNGNGHKAQHKQRKNYKHY